METQREYENKENTVLGGNKQCSSVCRGQTGQLATSIKICCILQQTSGPIGRGGGLPEAADINTATLMDEGR